MVSESAEYMSYESDRIFAHDPGVGVAREFLRKSNADRYGWVG
jgi:hypothetical protein